VTSSSQVVPEDAAFVDALQALKAGDLVVLPTETVYGLAADATNALAVASIFEAKGRPSINPLISHVADLDMARAHGRFSEMANALAEAFWPGPLTIVVERTPTSSVAGLACAGLPTIALRVPSAALMRRLSGDLGRPIAAPSANASGTLSPTRVGHAVASLGDAPALYVDGGPCEHGLESTIVTIVDGAPVILRVGAITAEEISAIAGRAARIVAPHDAAAPTAPGMLLKHYAPRARVRLGAEKPDAGEAFLGFGGLSGPGGLNLSPSGDLKEAAANLFDFLHILDDAAPACIAVAPIPMVGLGISINERLERAARGR
jgi:L-threonylcarbamoyladenylate synthase